jgi:hypothetical protein
MNIRPKIVDNYISFANFVHHENGEVVPFRPYPFFLKTYLNNEDGILCEQTSMGMPKASPNFYISSKDYYVIFQIGKDRRKEQRQEYIHADTIPHFTDNTEFFNFLSEMTPESFFAFPSYIDPVVFYLDGIDVYSDDSLDDD